MPCQSISARSRVFALLEVERVGILAMSQRAPNTLTQQPTTMGEISEQKPHVWGEGRNDNQVFPSIVKKIRGLNAGNAM